MAQDSDLPKRKSVRIYGRDYSQPASNYVTICTQGKACLFGRVVHGVMRLNESGRMVLREWARIADRFPDVSPVDVVVMPNHLHGVLFFRDRKERTPDPSATLGRIVGAFKSTTTVLYGRGVEALHWPRFDRRLWQRGYWERVLRDRDEYLHARSYIEANPARWERDRLHPALPWANEHDPDADWWE